MVTSPPPRSTHFSLWWAGGFLLFLSVGAASCLLHAVGQRTRALGDGQNPESYGFSLEPLCLRRAPLVGGGLPRDGIKALKDPPVASPAQIAHLARGRFLLPEDLILGVVLGGEARAYPLRILVFHEAINDQLAGLPILVVHNPLSGTSAVFLRPHPQLTFGHSGLVWNSCSLLYDRTPGQESLWFPLTGQAVAGPQARTGAHLPFLPSTLTTWKRWLASHPHTSVVAPQSQFLRLYRRDPYASYLGSDLLRFPVDRPLPPQTPFPGKTPLLILWPQENPQALVLPQLPPGTHHLELAGRHLRLTVIPRPLAVEVEPADGQPPPATLHTFAFAWYATGGSLATPPLKSPTEFLN